MVTMNDTIFIFIWASQILVYMYGWTSWGKLLSCTLDWGWKSSKSSKRIASRGLNFRIVASHVLSHWRSKFTLGLETVSNTPSFKYTPLVVRLSLSSRAVRTYVCTCEVYFYVSNKATDNGNVSMNCNFQQGVTKVHMHDKNKMKMLVLSSRYINRHFDTIFWPTYKVVLSAISHCDTVFWLAYWTCSVKRKLRDHLALCTLSVYDCACDCACDCVAGVSTFHVYWGRLQKCIASSQPQTQTFTVNKP